MIRISLGMQDPEARVVPAMQLQLKDPIAFVQRAFEPQMDTVSRHSLTSLQEPVAFPVKPELHSHVPFTQLAWSEQF